jgi:hypothetical protein
MLIPLYTPQRTLQKFLPPQPNHHSNSFARNVAVTWPHRELSFPPVVARVGLCGNIAIAFQGWQSRKQTLYTARTLPLERNQAYAKRSNN